MRACAHGSELEAKVVEVCKGGRGLRERSSTRLRMAGGCAFEGSVCASYEGWQ